MKKASTELRQVASAVLSYDAILFMKVGPHSGFTLDEIYKMKSEEEGRFGRFYWGYAGSLCYPTRVRSFAMEADERLGRAPKVVMATTTAKYVNKTVGTIGEWSLDKSVFHPVEDGVTLIGCTIAILCQNLMQVDATLDLDQYAVANGAHAGRRLSRYIQHQVNKACAIRAGGSRNGQSVVRISAVADLVVPYCVYLRE